MEKGLLFFIYIYTVQSLKNVRVILFLFILIHLSFVINATNFFIHSLKRFVLGKYCLTGFLQLGALFIPCMWTYSKNIGRIANIPIVSYFFVFRFVKIQIKVRHFFQIKDDRVRLIFLKCHREKLSFRNLMLSE